MTMDMNRIEKIPAGGLAIEGFLFEREEIFSCGGAKNRIEIYLHEKTNLEFALLPGGPFTMGSPAEEEGRVRYEGPQHKVTLPPFLLSRTPCTQEAWDAVGGMDDRKWQGDDLPIERVAWEDCFAWCRSLGFRLPSEAEWEYACRAGTTTPYFFGESGSELARYAWFSDNAEGMTHPVGRKKPNAFGLHDMHGNVWEWCQDECHDTYAGAPVDGKPWEDLSTGSQSDRVERGGAWYDKGPYLRSAFRYRGGPNTRGTGLGFRPARHIIL